MTRVTLQHRLRYEGRLEWGVLLAFLAPRCLPGVEEVRDGVWRRGGTEADHEPGAATGPTGNPGRGPGAGAGPGGTVVIRSADPEAPERVRRLFALDADPAPAVEALARDPLLAPLVRARPGLRVPGAWDPFELAVRAVLGQGVTVAGATTLAGRLVRVCGGDLSPAALAGADLRRVGLPRARADALHALAGAALGGRLDLRRIEGLPGIGPWTAGYVAMRALGDPDAFPAGDLGIRRALGGIGAREAVARAERWRPWRALAVMHLWLGG